jgi:hypothetical protein
MLRLPADELDPAGHALQVSSSLFNIPYDPAIHMALQISFIYSILYCSPSITLQHKPISSK